jgi:uncharacterized lipoprotein
MPINYAPSSVLSATGSVSVMPFTYLPAQNGRVKQNQIRNTAMGTLLFEQNIDTIIKEAVFKELRFVGVKTDSPNIKLSGEVQEFLIDDLGYSVDWTLRVRYVVTKNDGTLSYDSLKNIQKRTSKFANVFGALNEIIKANIEELIKDEAFRNAIK